MIKEVIKELFALFLIQVYYISQKKRDDILSIYFHNPSEKVFENVLKWLVVKNYKFISTNELYFLINGKVKQTGKLACITFDDGWSNNMMLVNLLEKYKIPVTIFIPTEAIVEGNYWFEYANVQGQKQFTGIKTKENFKKLPENIFTEKVKILKLNYSLKRSSITLNDLKKLSENKLITIGSHSVTHPILNRCSFEKQEYELAESKKIISNWLYKDIEYLAYPNGDFNQYTIEIAKKCGYKLGFSTELGKIDVKKVNPFIIPRHVIHDTGGHYENISKALGIWQRFIKKDGHFLNPFYW